MGFTSAMFFHKLALVLLAVTVVFAEPLRWRRGKRGWHQVVISDIEYQKQQAYKKHNYYRSLDPTLYAKQQAYKAYYNRELNEVELAKQQEYKLLNSNRKLDDEEYAKQQEYKKQNDRKMDDEEYAKQQECKKQNDRNLEVNEEELEKLERYKQEYDGDVANDRADD